MNSQNINISIEDNAWQQELPEFQQISEQIMKQTIAYVKSNEVIDFLVMDKPLNVNIALSNDEAVRLLNAEFRKMDKPTNVLSFANIDDENFDSDIHLFDEIELGDIIIALETMQREAKEKNISFQDHYSHLLTHGLLHLLGYDHQEDDEAEHMENFETRILANMGIANPYQE